MAERSRSGPFDTAYDGPFAPAYKRGREDYAANKPRTRCPYADRTTGRGSVTFSRAWRKAWFSGWDDAAAEDAEGGK